MPSSQSGMWEGLLPFCLGDQERKIRAIIQCGGNIAQAARLIGVTDRKFRESLKSLRERATLQGHMPELGINAALPAPFVADRVTVGIKDDNGNRHWLKGKVDDIKRADMIRASLEAFKDDISRFPPSKPVKIGAPDLATLYTFTDCHVGAYAWAAEGGSDWNLDIAERTLVGAGVGLMRSAPKANTGIISIQGDWHHYDGPLPVTPTHQHVLDAAGRPGEMITYSIRIVRRLIQEALKRHEKVIVVVSEGNHDPVSSRWLRESIAIAYEKDSRVSVPLFEGPFYAMTFGKNLLGWHHGHTKKNESLPLLFADLYAEMWGRTKAREIHTGHHHHEHRKEYTGATVHQHSTVMARDSYASRHGFMSRRETDAITYHLNGGRLCMNFFRPEMLEAA